jgi:hypothetical protein
MLNSFMNTKNKYYRWYTSIIQKAQKEHRKKGKGVYYEAHHVIPLSLGGPDVSDNVVLLTAKEHGVCHHLLIKFTEGEDRSKMFYAFWSLVNGWGKHRDGHRITVRQYAILKKEISKQISILNSGRTHAPMSEENKEKARIRMQGENNPMRKMTGINNPNFGKKRPGIGGRKRGTGWSSSERQKQMNIRSEPGYYNFLSDPERGRKISQAQKGRKGTSTGTVWYNDGTKEFQGYSIPPGFNKGRLITNNSKKGLKWFNNGIENRQFREGTQPKGYINGRISKK